MNKTARILSVMLAILMVVSAMTFTASAKPQVLELDGQQLVYVGEMGKVIDGGKTYEAFKTFTDGLQALGTEGGIIRFYGPITLGTDGDTKYWVDVPGRKHVTIQGIGWDNAIDYTGGAWISITPTGDTTFDNCYIITHASNEYPIFNAGYTITMGTEEGPIETGRAGVGTMALCVYGSNSVEGTPAGKTIINSGSYDRVANGSHYDTEGGKKIIGSPELIVNGGTIKFLYGGFANTANGDNIIEGDAYITINGGKIGGEFYAGSKNGGEITGNSYITINGGTISSVKAGCYNYYPENSPKRTQQFTANSIITINGGDFLGAQIGSTKKGYTGGGLEIFIINTTKYDFTVSDKNESDYFVYMMNGKAAAKFDGRTLLGFEITDNDGNMATTVYANGEEIKQNAHGYFDLPKGKSEVTVGYAQVAQKEDSTSAYIKGYPDGTFLPQNNMTRAEAVTTLLRLLVDEADVKGKFQSTFTDVKTHWAYDNIAYFQTMGYLDSYEGTFKPDQKITREEFVELVINISDIKNYMFKTFSDVDEDHPRYFPITVAASTGLVTGYPDGTFKPDGNITRAEVVTVVNRYLKRTPTGKAGEVTFSDIKGHWAEGQVLAAVNEAESNGVTVWTETVNTYDYKVEGESIEEYIDALYDAQADMTAEQFVDAIDTVAEKAIDDIINEENIDPSTFEGAVYYISPNGDDSNDGKSPETAWKSLGKANAAVGAAVLFERGGTWRGNLWPKQNMTYSAYGEGEKPRIYGSAKNYAGKSNWEATEYANVYKLKDKLVNVGIVTFNNTGELGVKDYLVGSKGIAGYGTFKDVTSLSTDLQYYSDLKTNEFYLYSAEGNPGTRFDQIEIGVNSDVINCRPGAHVDNLIVMFGGAHGIAAGGTSDLTVTNCIVAWMGGSQLGSATTVYGNAIQIYGGVEGFYVNNNWCYQCYDTGITLQYSGANVDCIMRDVAIRENVVEHCYWNLEFYNMGGGETNTRVTEDFDLSYNILRYAGKGWGADHRAKNAPSFYIGPMQGERDNCLVEKNVLEGSHGTVLLIADENEDDFVCDSNIYVQAYNFTYGSMDGNTAKAVEDANVQVLETYNDENAIVLVYDVFANLNFTNWIGDKNH